MWVWLKFQLVPKGDFSVVSVTACFVNFFMHSPKEYLNGRDMAPCKWGFFNLCHECL